MVVPKSISEDDTLLSPTDVAEELGVHRSTVHNWIREGWLKTKRHGAFHAVSRKELARFRKFYKIDPADRLNALFKSAQGKRPKRRKGKRKKK